MCENKTHKLTIHYNGTSKHIHTTFQDKSDALRTLRQEAAQASDMHARERGAQSTLIDHLKAQVASLSEDRTKWEGMARELKEALEESTSTHADALYKAHAAQQAAEKLAEEERQRRLRLHAADGTVMGVESSVAGDGPSTPRLSPGAARAMSTTDLYTRLVEAQDRARQEHLKRRECEIVLEQLFASIEEKAGVLSEQQREYEHLKEANAQLTAQFQSLNGERKGHEARLAQLEAELRREQRQCRYVCPLLCVGGGGDGTWRVCLCSRASVNNNVSGGGRPIIPLAS